MKRVSLGVFLLCLIMGTLGNLTRVNAQNEDAQRARELWEQVITAKGGRERLFAVRSLVVSTRTKNIHPTKDFPGHHFESLFVLPDKWWFWADECPGLGLSIWTYDFSRQVGQEVWDASPAVRTYRPTIPLTDKAIVPLDKKDDIIFRFVKEQFIEKQLIYLMETKWLQPTIVKAWTDRLGFKKVDVLETSYGRERFEFYVDRETHLPVQVIIRTRIERTGREVVDGFILGDYAEVAGIKFPRIVRRGGERNETTYQVNVDYDAGIFERPPAIDMGPEAWKRSK